MILLEKLLNNMPEYYDKAEYPVKVFTVTQASNIIHDADSGVFKINTGSVETILNVRGKTIAEIKALVTAAGFTVVANETKYDGLFWFTLQSGNMASGMNYESSLLRRLWGGVAQFLVDTRVDFQKGIDECFFNKSGGDWLNLWTSYFGHSRITGEVDSGFLNRVLAEIKCLKNNDTALAKLISAATGFSCKIRGVAAKNCFGVYFSVVNITVLPQAQKDLIIDTINKYKAAGNFPVFYVSNSLLRTNTTGETANAANYVVAPSDTGFTLVTITHS